MDRANCCPASIGNCEIIKNLQKEKRTLSRTAWITYFVALLIAICFVIRTFWPKEMNIPKSININIVDAQGHGKELSAEGKVYLKEQLHTALMEVSARAETAYNEKFAALLTVLTIFGIAWPVIIALLQFRFNENELNKIDSTHERVENALTSLNKQKAETYAGFAQMAYDMGCEVVERLKCYPGDGREVQWEEKIDTSPADIYFLQSINYRLLEAESDINRLRTTAITLTIDKVSDKRSADQVDALESCIINAQRIYKTTLNADITEILKKLENKKTSRRGDIMVTPLSNDDIADKKTSHDKGETKSNQEARG